MTVIWLVSKLQHTAVFPPPLSEGCLQLLTDLFLTYFPFFYENVSTKLTTEMSHNYPWW